MLILVLLRLFLIAVPLAVVGFSIYWIMLISEPVFVASCGQGRMVLGVLLLLVSLASSILAFLGFRELPKIDYSSIFLHAYLITTFVAVMLCATTLVATSNESQGFCAAQIDEYCVTLNNTRASAFLAKYDTQYKRYLYEFSFGQRAYEAYFITGSAWASSVVLFFAIAELQ